MKQFSSDVCENVKSLKLKVLFKNLVSRSEMPGKFWNVVLKKDGEDQFYWLIGFGTSCVNVSARV
jgi:hypothetical protein